MSKMAFTRFGGQFQFEKSNGGQVRQFWGRALHKPQLPPIASSPGLQLLALASSHSIAYTPDKNRQRHAKKCGEYITYMPKFPK